MYFSYETNTDFHVNIAPDVGSRLCLHFIIYMAQLDTQRATQDDDLSRTCFTMKRRASERSSVLQFERNQNVVIERAAIAGRS